MRRQRKNVAGIALVTSIFSDGEILPLHSHREPKRQHITAIVSGAFTHLCAEGERGALTQGQIVEFAPGEIHGFRALNEGATICNIGPLDPDLPEFDWTTVEYPQG